MNTELKHIRSMAEMILSELDKFEGTQPVTKPDRVPKFKVGDRVQTRSGTQGVVTAVYYNCGAHCYDVQYVESKCPISGCYLESELHKVEVSKPEPKFKVGDRVVWLSALNEKVLTIVRVSHDQFNMDAHAAGRVTFPNETGVYFQYVVTTERGDIATFGENALKLYAEPKAGPKFKVGDRVKVQNTYYYQGGEKLGVIVFVGAANSSSQVYGVEFSNGTDVCFHEADLSEPEAAVDKAEVTQIWHRGEPPHIGWWNASRTCDSKTWGRVWSWWDGKCWSAAAYPTDSMVTVKQMANWKVDTNDIKWTDYWPENARVPRIDPGV